MPANNAPAELTAGDAQLRSAYLAEVLAVLYPEPESGSGDGIEYLVVPDARRPRLLVPADDRKLAAAAVRRYAEPTSRLARLKRDAVVAALKTGASGLLLRDKVRVGGSGGIDEYLKAALGQDVRLSVHIGPARANRKPVIQLLTPAGATVGFVKLGVNDLTRRLVRAETNALSTLACAGLEQITTPAVLHSGEWRGNEVLAQSALPIWQPRAPMRDRLPYAMRELAEAFGITRCRLAQSEYRGRLSTRLNALTSSPDGRVLARAGADLIQRAGSAQLSFGAWHGDWTPWNMAALSDTLLVWDWERFTTGVPIGFDAAHYALQSAIVTAGREPATAVDTVIETAPALLAPFGVGSAAARITVLLYLADLAARYLTDRQAEAGARLGVLGSWLLPALVRRVAHL
ncbi:hypothetical protein [Longispora albida]|uniref:hypothetical protein n=1 Tax=Longispora albida TaxID=203523 RepID=UPI001FE0A3B0|nr:hypothetical protein [Longispora albida]